MLTAPEIPSSPLTRGKQLCCEARVVPPRIFSTDVNHVRRNTHLVGRQFMEIYR
jgi:hypothetical protein